MADYDYNDGRVQLDDSDSSKNGAQQLPGYPLNIRPDGRWPGTNAAKSQRVNVENMRTVADKIKNLVEQLTNGGSSSIGSTAAVSYGPGSWDAANFLQQASGQVASTVGSYTQKLIQNLTSAAAAIEAAATAYEATEKSNQKSAKNQQGSLDAPKPI